MTGFPYFDLLQVQSITQVVNQVTVEGSFLRELNADMAIADTDYTGDGGQVKFAIGDLWVAATGNDTLKVFINDGADSDPTWGAETEKTVGLAGGDTLVSHDTLWDPAGRTLEWATAPPDKTHSFRIVGDRLRALIHTEPLESSITDLGRIYGYSVKDVTLLSEEHVIFRAKAELDKRGAEAERLTCMTLKDGIDPGKTLGVINTILGIGSTGVPKYYLVDKVLTRLLGGQMAQYDLQLTER